MTHTPLHHVSPNGKITISPQVFRLDDHQKIYRRPRHWQYAFGEFVLTWAMPAIALACLVAFFLLTYWLISGIVRTLGVG